MVKKLKDGEGGGPASSKKHIKSSKKKGTSKDSKEPCHGPRDMDHSWRSGTYSMEEELQSIQREKERLTQLEEEERQRRLAEEEEKKRRGEHNKNMRKDLVNLRVSQGISQPWKFSYFQYVPPKAPQGKEKSGVSKIRSKTKKPS